VNLVASEARDAMRSAPLPGTPQLNTSGAVVTVGDPVRCAASGEDGSVIWMAAWAVRVPQFVPPTVPVRPMAPIVAGSNTITGTGAEAKMPPTAGALVITT